MNTFIKIMWMFSILVFIAHILYGPVDTLERSGFNVAIWSFINIFLSEKG